MRGFQGEAAAERAIEALRDAGISVGANVTLTRATFDLLPATAARVADLGAREIQLLRYKPGGRAADPSYGDRRLSPDQIERLWPSIQDIVEAGRLRVRIDCAMVPLLSNALIERCKDAARLLASLGVFGCEAARHLGGMRVDGSLAPCSFFSAEPGRARAPSRSRRALPLVEIDLAQGDRRLDAGRGIEEIDRFRAYHAALPEPCRSCELVSVCRGGCQVVSRHAGETRGAFAPDPECPRVRRAASTFERSIATSAAR